MCVTIHTATDAVFKKEEICIIVYPESAIFFIKDVLIDLNWTVKSKKSYFENDLS